MVYLTRRERFNAAHRLYNPTWDDAKNFEVYGKCANPNWHGHNYELFITIKGKVDVEKGWVVDLKLLSDIVNEYIIEKLDHKNINLDVDFMLGKQASVEVLVVEIWRILAAKISNIGAKLYKLKLVETENNFVEYFGENDEK